MSITNSQLIEQYQSLHKNQKYGKSAKSAGPSLKLCISELVPHRILEYGCGQSELYKSFTRTGVVFDRYDPAISNYKNIPGNSYDFIINTDVLEHIPEEDVPAVLQHLRELSPHVFLRICTRPARTILANGQNAHPTVWPKEKWLEIIRTVYPEAIMPFFVDGENCLILTWSSSCAQKITLLETKLEKKRRGRVRAYFKKIERFFKHMRNSLLGRNIHKQT